MTRDSNRSRKQYDHKSGVYFADRSLVKLAEVKNDVAAKPLFSKFCSFCPREI